MALLGFRNFLAILSKHKKEKIVPEFAFNTITYHQPLFLQKPTGKMFIKNWI